METTLYSRRLCLVQLGTREEIVIVDALQISDFEPLVALLGHVQVVKVIHNASFEKGVRAVHGVEIRNIADTLELSRAKRGREIEGGHKLGSVCERELGIALDKSEQVSDWTRRPLSRRQLAYAALDVEVLLGLWDRLPVQVQGRVFELIAAALERPHSADSGRSLVPRTSRHKHPQGAKPHTVDEVELTVYLDLDLPWPAWSRALFCPGDETG